MHVAIQPIFGAYHGALLSTEHVNRIIEDVWWNFVSNEIIEHLLLMQHFETVNNGKVYLSNMARHTCTKISFLWDRCGHGVYFQRDAW